MAVVAAVGLTVAADGRPAYPVAKTVSQVDDYGGVKIPDPYRWLENLDSKDTADWVAAENKLTFGYLAAIPQRERIRTRLRQLFDYERYRDASYRGGRYFILHNDGLQNQDVLFTMDSLDGQERVLLDPNTLRADGTAALAGYAISRDGKRMAYGISEAGSDWQVWRVRDTATGSDLRDQVHWVKFSQAEWTPDNRAFYYSRFPEPAPGQTLTARNVNCKIYQHRLGEPQSDDTLVYERPDHPQWDFSGTLSEDGRYLVITVFDNDYGKNMLFYQDLQSPQKKTVELVDRLTALYNYLGNEGSTFFIQTTEGAPRGRVVAIDVTHPERGNWKELVPEQQEALDTAQVADRRLVVSYLKDAHAEAKIYTLDGRLEREIAFPGIGAVTWSPARQNDREMFYTFTTFTSPGTVYHLDVSSGRGTLYRAGKLNFDPNAYETSQVFYHSKDGTRVPMFLTHRKGIRLEGANPTLLYGYGGFNVAVTPFYSPAFLEWMEMGGVFAVANLRGGSEYGEAWHQAGMKEKKQNVFDDFIAAAEWLIRNRYTSSPKLAIMGGSNGGLLVGACLNQRRELFGAALPAVGVMDMLRFNKFTVGEAWTGEYGNPENPADFRVLRAYSPLHNIRKGAHYPAVLITTSDHDDRVVPGHSFKYAATLQAAQGGPAPILIRIETRAGHGGGKPVSKRMEEYADMWSFLAEELHMKID